MRAPRKALFITLILLVTFLQSPLAIVPMVHCAEGGYTGDHWDVSVQVTTPYGIASYGSNIWVVDLADKEICKYTMAGVYVSSWDTSAHGTDLYGVATDGTNIWTLSHTDKEVYKWNMAGGYIGSWDTSAHGANPRDITTDGSNIYVIDQISDEVYKYNMAGGYVSSWDTSANGNDPYGIATDGTNIWTLDGATNQVDKYDMIGNYIGTWPTSDQVTTARDITTNGTFFWIVDQTAKEVYKYYGPLQSGQEEDEWQVNANNNDCYVFGTTMRLSYDYILFVTNGYILEPGFRWTGITIPKDSTIVSAYLKVNSYTTFPEPNTDTIIRGDYEDDCSAFTTASNFNNRPRTDANVVWDYPATIANVWYSSPNLKDIIQEIIDRDGWESGNSLALFGEQTNSASGTNAYVSAFEKGNGNYAKLEVRWIPPPTYILENEGIEPSDSTVDDEQWFFLNASIEILTNTTTFLFNRIDIDPAGLNLSCSYTNATDTFVEENDPNDYLQLDVAISVKTNPNSTFVRLDYYIRIHPTVTKEGLYNVTVYSTASGDLSDTDAYLSVFTLTIRTPSAPTLLFGAGFNASSPSVELHWTHDLLIFTHFEIQDSANGVDWDYLGQNATAAQYTDSTVSNGTERYYKVRACRNTGVGWKNTTFTDVNFETVYFIEAVAAPPGNGIAPVPAVLVITFNTTIAEEGCGVYAEFSAVEGLSGYIFWNNATDLNGGVNSTFTPLAGPFDTAQENVTLPSSGILFGAKYYVNDTNNNWGVDTLVMFPSAEVGGDTYLTGSIGIFLICFIILLPIIFHAVKKR